MSTTTTKRKATGPEPRRGAPKKQQKREPEQACKALLIQHSKHWMADSEVFIPPERGVPRLREVLLSFLSEESLREADPRNEGLALLHSYVHGQELEPPEALRKYGASTLVERMRRYLRRTEDPAELARALFYVGRALCWSNADYRLPSAEIIPATVV